MVSRSNRIGVCGEFGSRSSSLPAYSPSAALNAKGLQSVRCVGWQRHHDYAMLLSK